MIQTTRSSHEYRDLQRLVLAIHTALDSVALSVMSSYCIVVDWSTQNAGFVTYSDLSSTNSDEQN